MSGGSMDYLYSTVSEANFRLNSQLRIAFKKHLDLVAKALHDIEWVDSSDYGEGDDIEAIKKCISTEFILKSTIDEAEIILNHLTNEIERAKNEITK